MTLAEARVIGRQQELAYGDQAIQGVSRGSGFQGDMAFDEAVARAKRVDQWNQQFVERPFGFERQRIMKMACSSDQTPDLSPAAPWFALLGRSCRVGLTDNGGHSLVDYPLSKQLFGRRRKLTAVIDIEKTSSARSRQRSFS